MGKFSPKRPRFWLGLGGGCLLLTALLGLLCGTAAGTAIRKFAAGLSGVLSFCCSFSRRPIGEWLLPIVVFGIPLTLLLAAIRGKWRGLGLWSSRMFSLCCAIVLLFTASFGVQYSGPDLAESLPLDTGAYTMEQLEDALTVLAQEINRVAPTVPRDADGNCDFGKFDDLAKAVMAAYLPLEQQIPALIPASRVAPKEALLLSVPMSYWGITGFFFPWTGECVVSGNNPVVQQPFTIAHESAHARSVGNEDEANFAAFLACVQSDDARLQYSGLHHAWIYVWNACYRSDSAVALAYRDALCEEARFDLSSVSRHWAKYEGWLEQLGTKVNDAYIKGTGQPDGVVAYSKAADLIIAYIHSDMNIFA